MRILILGGGVMQLPAARIARRKGWKVFVAARDIEPAVRALADEALEVDLRDRPEVEAEARRLRDLHGLDGVFTAGTDFSTTVAWVAEQLHLPGIPLAVAENATDKARMRARFRSRGVPCPRFFTIGPDSAPGRPQDFEFPLVVKPVDNMGARGVRRVDREEDYAAAVAGAAAQSRRGQVIVEEYMEGPELSLDAVVYRGRVTVCGVADRHICFPPFFVEMGHTMPSALDTEILHEAEEVFRAGIRALGIRNGRPRGTSRSPPPGPPSGRSRPGCPGGTCPAGPTRSPAGWRSPRRR